MNMQEVSRFFIALREMGLTDKEIGDLMIYVESGNDEYKPKKLNIQRD
ncbi:MAG: hypothetical protein J6M62_08125 [Selenomonadaceae bacterium]|nr:hypothetical protein [Selenomonadaceae bacterium]